ncbi:Ferredoxin-dependent glutamate synthase 1 [Propionispora sp. 2/2-37]|uniref:glutamate synthase large subunit n=1 Tax=Propionispora sp. 2/2-37 TaxID=1677858 RepID=UPI0006BB8976|nr:glutamate synthase large subunit [Propionispora sp. 2/2-37]CUH95144.1 Ferredoxin-dependent glutamate synthase 1 [Propionispora sp. 2/2-37]
MNRIKPLQKQGLYHPEFEHDSCGMGFIVNIKGNKSNRILKQALTALKNLSHRGGTGSEPNTGDGAGILLQIPHTFMKKVCRMSGFDLPGNGAYGVGMVFLPTDGRLRHHYETCLETIIAEEGQKLLGWRDVPTNTAGIGKTARECMPYIRQIFIGRSNALNDLLAFERKLFVIRKRAEKEVPAIGENPSASFYIASLSAKTLVYKGMLKAEQVGDFYPDLCDPCVETALALIHSRYSTNTFPSWERAHPNRYIIHNGEINTLRGNINQFHARESLFETPAFGKDLPKVLPVIHSGGSDSAIFDNCAEFLLLSGRSLPHVMMMMIPEPWSGHESMSKEKKAFYEFHSCLMEPWDGPAAIGFTDGIRVGAVLDRNGLRPSRYYVTTDDLVILASEVGVLDIPPEKILQKERLHPGRMLLIDTEKGRIIQDEELKHNMSVAKPYRQWLNQQMFRLDALPPAQPVLEADKATLVQKQRNFGYSYEDLRMILVPMARDGIEPVGAMGTDTPLAVLSQKPQLLFDYFKQLFAQVTNPPIDALRETIVTSSEVLVGAEQNLLAPASSSCRRIKLSSPILANHELEKLKQIRLPGFKAATLPILYKTSAGSRGLEAALTALFFAAEKAVRNGVNILILTDRGIDRDHAAIPSLLAVSGLYHHLIQAGLKTRASIILESGEPREVHHFSCLLSYGATAVNPYLAFDSIDAMIDEGFLETDSREKVIAQYIKAAVKGVIKTLSKMGISTIQSYQGAQIFEALGLNHEFVDRYFTWTPSRIGGIGIEEIAKETELRHTAAFPSSSLEEPELDSGGFYQYRRNGEYHLYNPETVHALQLACRTGSFAAFKNYSALINDSSKRLCTLRGLMQFKINTPPVPLEEVEPVESIVKKFKTGAMSFGSISQEAHETIAIAMNRLGGRSNTGEGGENPARFKMETNGDSKCSAIKQVASARFGVTSEYLVSANEIQIKMAQGAKPGEGGQLPGGKVYPWIAKVRHSTPGVGLISPPPHHDIYSIEDLKELIHDLKNANPAARISVKLVSEAGVGTIAAGVAKGLADVILISGYDGGTGASPRSSIRHAGLPWELGLAETHQTLLLNNLRSRIALETDGKLMTGRDVAIAALLGAEEFGFATAPLVVLGCVMMRVCHLDTCPVGVATQNPKLRKKFSGDPQYVMNFMRFIAQELREIMAMLGFRSLNEMVGRSDRLEMKPAIDHWKARGLDYSAILHQPEVPDNVGHYCQIFQDHVLDQVLDNRLLLDICQPALESGKKVKKSLSIHNTDRTVGTILGSKVTAKYGAAGLPEDTITLHFTGSAGQSFGAFLPPGITLKLEGDSNDYIGKGLSGGKIIVYPPKQACFAPSENIIIGNVAFYGATRGEAYINGVAGERFCVRNSGITAVVEAVGDHGCEYMTGGRVVILGPTGRNFAAGMSGGIAYILDENNLFNRNCNKEMVDLTAPASKTEFDELYELIKKHLTYTGSPRAREVLDDWDELRHKFIKVIPHDYRRMLTAIDKAHKQGLTGDAAWMAAFEENHRDLARIGGN